MTSEQSKVLTLVFTDLADSTALKSERGDAAVGELIARHREHVSQLAERCAGRIIDWAGDGCFLTFETSSAAVTFALRLQQVHHYESDLPGVRVGVHMGEVTEKAHDGAVRIEGLAVDLSARIGGLAAPGQVLISGAIQQSAKQRLGIHEFGQPVRWESYGLYALKGFDEALDVREAGLEDISPFKAPSESDKARPVKSGGGYATPERDAPIRKLAVLPLTNLSGDEKQEYFADGMTEAVITELAKIKALRVISRTSVMRYKHTTKSLTEIARELDVDGLIEGSVLRAGNDVRITAQFIRGNSDEHLWAEHYDGRMEDILKLQKEVALAIADGIQVTVSAGERMELRSAKRIDPDAFDRYLKAARFGGDWAPASIQRSLEELNELEKLVPEFGRLNTLKGTALFTLGMSGLLPSGASFGGARREARRALRKDASDSGAHSLLGWIAMSFEWDWEEAQDRFERGMAVDSSNHFIYSGLGYLYALSARLDDALSITRQGAEIDPHNAPAHHNTGMMHFFRREYREALVKMTDSLNCGKRVLPPRVDGTIIASCAGDHALALEHVHEAIDISGAQPHLLAYKAYALARAGEVAEASAILDTLTNDSGREQVLWADLAVVNVALGHTDAALAALVRALREREYLAVLIGVSPVYDPLREHPRFRELIAQLDYPARVP